VPDLVAKLMRTPFTAVTQQKRQQGSSTAVVVFISCVLVISCFHDTVISRVKDECMYGAICDGNQVVHPSPVRSVTVKDNGTVSKIFIKG